ncbi:MAG TPA: hypothetical protein VFG78_07000 [Gemmatimonadota bacterium]|nr:hypothetical protein [Gemmatimonadota bacterium]
MRSILLLLSTTCALGIAACSERSDPMSVDDGSELQPSKQQPVYEIAQLPSLEGAGSSGNGINNQGDAAGFSNLMGGQISHAVLWRSGSAIDLGTLGGPGTNSNVAWPGLNNHGMVVGIAETDEPGGENWPCQFFFASSTGHQCLGFVWENGVMTPLPTWPGGTNGFATGINNRGQVVGWAENGVEDPTCNAPVVHQFRAFKYDTKTGGMEELAPLPGDSTSAATAINQSGQVVGISGECANAVGGFSAQHAVLWGRNGTPTEIDNLGGDAWHTPMDINEHGDVVGFGNPASVPGDAFGIHAFYWTRHGGIEDLGVFDGDNTSQALGINDRGQVVGVSSGPGDDTAFLWEGGELIDLNTLAPDYEGTLIAAGHINDAGVITGVARDADTGELVTFIATPRGRQ